MRIIWGYFKERAWFALLLVLCVGLFAQVLRLYDLPAEAVGYASLLCAAAFAVWTAVDLLRCRERVRYLESLRGQAALLLDQLPEARGPREEVYQALLLELGDTLRAVSSASDARRRRGRQWTITPCGSTRSRPPSPPCACSSGRTRRTTSGTWRRSSSGWSGMWSLP